MAIASNGYAQLEASKWYFGAAGEGLDFLDHCDPLVLSNGAIEGNEGCCTISDPSTGELLFYTNSERVWDRAHNLMPNGDLISLGWTITQVVAFRKPGSLSQFYIFTSEVQGSGEEGIRFHCVDLGLNGGMGDLLYKDSVAYSGPVSEKLTAVRHANGTDVWVLAHGYGNNEFYAFEVNSSGVNILPVISALGKVHGDPSTVDALGEMKADPTGTRIALVTTFQPDVELLDFDRSTGTIDNLRILDAPGGYDGLNASGWYGVSFSKSSSKLYVSSGGPLNYDILQFDLSVNDQVAINASRYVVSSSVSNCFSMKLAPNGRIYVGRHENYLGEIVHPDSMGLACAFDPQGVVFPQLLSSTTWGLNNHMETQSYYCEPGEVGIAPDGGRRFEFSIGPNPANDALVLFHRKAGLRSVRIISCLGAVVHNASYMGDRHAMDIRDLPSGAYSVVVDGDQGSQSRHFIIQR